MAEASVAQMVQISATFPYVSPETEIHSVLNEFNVLEAAMSGEANWPDDNLLKVAAGSCAGSR